MQDLFTNINHKQVLECLQPVGINCLILLSFDTNRTTSKILSDISVAVIFHESDYFGFVCKLLYLHKRD